MRPKSTTRGWKPTSRGREACAMPRCIPQHSSARRPLAGRLLGDDMANRFGHACVSGLVGAAIGGVLVVGFVWTGPVASRDRAIVELEQALEEQDAKRDDACAVEDDVDTDEENRPRGELWRAVRI